MMNSTPTPHSTSASPAPVISEAARRVEAARRIDAACDRWEEAWLAGQPTRLEDLVATFEEPLRASLLRQLLLVEWEYLHRRGETVNVRNYIERFPDYSETICQARLDHSLAMQSWDDELPDPVPDDSGNAESSRGTRVHGTAPADEPVGGKAGLRIAARLTRIVERSWIWIQRHPVTSSLLVLLPGISLAFWLAAGAFAEPRPRVGVPTSPARDVPHGKPKAPRVDFQLRMTLEVESLRTAALRSDARIVLTGGWDGMMRWWDVADTSAPAPQTGLTHPDSVLALAWSPDGERVVTGCGDGIVRLWNAASWVASGVEFKHAAAVRAVAFSPDGKQILTGSDDRTAQLWDAESGERIGPPLPHPNGVCSLAFSPDGRTLLTGSSDRTARLWDATAGQPLGVTVRHDLPIVSVAFSPAGTTMVTGSWDKSARVWDRATGQPVGPVLRHPQAVMSVTFSPDGQMILAGCRDHRVYLWETATGESLGAPLEHSQPVEALGFRSDGRILMTAGPDAVRLWER